MAFPVCSSLPVQFCPVTGRPCPALHLSVHLMSKNAFLPCDDGSPASLSGSGKLIFYQLVTRGQIACGNIHALLCKDHSSGHDLSVCLSGDTHFRKSSVNVLVILKVLTWRRLPWWLRWLSICLQCGRPRFNPWKISWRRKWQPTPVFLPGKSHGQRSLVGCSQWGRKKSYTTERLHSLYVTFSFSFLSAPKFTVPSC